MRLIGLKLKTRRKLYCQLKRFLLLLLAEFTKLRGTRVNRPISFLIGNLDTNWKLFVSLFNDHYCIYICR